METTKRDGQDTLRTNAQTRTNGAVEGYEYVLGAAATSRMELQLRRARRDTVHEPRQTDG
jgi:hypothetical protein